MSKVLRLRQSEAAKQRSPIGSDNNSEECFDCISICKISIVTLDQKLQFQEKKLWMYESLLCFSHAGFLFNTSKPDNQTEQDFIDAYRNKFMGTNHRYIRS